jgi:hypothetical protein
MYREQLIRRPQEMLENAKTVRMYGIIKLQLKRSDVELFAFAKLNSHAEADKAHEHFTYDYR